VTFAACDLLTCRVVLFAGYARKTTQGLVGVDQCAVGVATGVEWLRSSIAVIASTTGVVTSSAKPAPRKSKSTDVAKRIYRYFFTVAELLNVSGHKVFR